MGTPTHHSIYVYKQPVMQQLIWMWASPRHSAVACPNSSCMRVMGHIVWVSVRMQMNGGDTRAMCEGSHVCLHPIRRMDIRSCDIDTIFVENKFHKWRVIRKIREINGLRKITAL